MFKKNNTTDNYNPYDVHYKEKIDMLDDMRTSLKIIVNKIILKNATLNIYPESCIKEQVKQEIVEEQQKLICCMGGYDETLSEITQYWRKHREQLNHCAQWTPYQYLTSQRIVELTCEQFYTND